MVMHEHKAFVLLAEDKGVPLPCIPSHQSPDCVVAQRARESDMTYIPTLHICLEKERGERKISDVSDTGDASQEVC